MKREQAYIDERRKQILELIRENPKIRIDELAGRLQVSMLTIRRDLQYLQDEKLLVRVRGGAAFPEPEDREAVEEDEINMYRRLIAQCAALFVEEGDSLFLNSSGNALQMLEYIRMPNVTVITNNGGAVQTAHHPGVNILLTGGEIRLSGNGMAGDFAMRNLRTVFAGKAFLGCAGISRGSGLTTEAAGEAEIDELMIRNTVKEVFVLADHRKVGRGCGFISSPVQKLRHLITDEKAPEEALDELRDAGVQIHQVHRGDFRR